MTALAEGTRTLPEVTGLTITDAAIEYTRSGFAVFPLEPGSKEPARGFRWKEAAYATPEEVAASWPGPEYGIGMPLAANGLVALDVDHPDALPLELDAVLGIDSTAQQSTDTADAQRLHHVYATAERYGNSTSGFPAEGWGDVRGEGYIAVEPTPHPRPTGHYQWKARTIRPLPAPLAAWLRPASESAPEASSSDVTTFLASWARNDAPERLDASLALLRDRVAGGVSRNEALATTAGRVFREVVAGCYPAQMAYDALIEAVQPYEPGRAEGILARAIGYVNAEDAEEVRREFGALHVIGSAVDDDEEAFWESRLTLSTIRQMARARLAGPWAVLGGVLARVVAATEPDAYLPPTVMGKASLNLFVALVGPSGAGKGGAMAVARDVLDIVDPAPKFQVGSGEGLIHTFARAAKDENGVHCVEMIRDRALFDVPEVDSLTALTSGRSGSTLMPTLRSAWAGEALGRTTASAERNVGVEEHTYRLALVVGVQPGRAAGLFDDADGGTPQRFVWLPVTDPLMAIGHKEPTPLRWARPTWPMPGGKVTVWASPAKDRLLPICETARTEIQEAHIKRGRGEGVALDGHALLARLKLGAALGLLEGRFEVTEEDWQLAGIVMRRSDATRTSIQRQARERDELQNASRGKAAGVQKAVADETEAEMKTARAARLVRARLEGVDGWVSRSEIRKTLRSDLRPRFDDALAALVTSGAVEERPTSNGQGSEIRLVA